MRSSSNSEAAKQAKQKCVRCHGSGRIVCEICGGRGSTLLRVGKLGHPEYKACRGCFGLKTMRCRTCGGTG
jgi:hypothetical protein